MNRIRPPRLTKREYFAALALQAIIAKAPYRKCVIASDTTQVEAIARGARSYADALVRILEEQ